MQYAITIAIDEAGVTQITALQQYVTIVKSLMSSSPSVAWLAFTPLTANNITWSDSYGVYASASPDSAGSQIALTYQSDALEGWIYTFENNAFTQGEQGMPNAYGVINLSGGMQTMGLAQSAVVNVSAPATTAVNALPILNNETAEFIPNETVMVFLSNTASGGTVLSSAIPSNAATVQLSPTSPVAALGFVDVTSTFYVLSSAQNEIHEPKRRSVPSLKNRRES